MRGFIPLLVALSASLTTITTVGALPQPVLTRRDTTAKPKYSVVPLEPGDNESGDDESGGGGSDSDSDNGSNSTQTSGSDEDDVVTVVETVVKTKEPVTKVVTQTGKPKTVTAPPKTITKPVPTTISVIGLDETEKVKVTQTVTVTQSHPTLSSKTTQETAPANEPVTTAIADAASTTAEPVPVNEPITNEPISEVQSVSDTQSSEAQIVSEVQSTFEIQTISEVQPASETRTSTQAETTSSTLEVPEQTIESQASTRTETSQSTSEAAPEISTASIIPSVVSTSVTYMGSSDSTTEVETTSALIETTTVSVIDLTSTLPTVIDLTSTVPVASLPTQEPESSTEPIELVGGTATGSAESVSTEGTAVIVSSVSWSEPSYEPIATWAGEHQPEHPPIAETSTSTTCPESQSTTISVPVETLSHSADVDSENTASWVAPQHTTTESIFTAAGPTTLITMIAEVSTTAVPGLSQSHDDGKWRTTYPAWTGIV